MHSDNIMTLPEVAELLRIAEKTVYSLSQRGEIPAFKVGGQWRFSRAAIDSWIETMTGTPQDPANAPEPPQAEGASPGSRAKSRRRRR